MELLYSTIPKKDTILEFIDAFYSFYKDHYSKKAHATFLDKECTKKHCASCKWRSFDDLYLVVKSVYPEITEKELMHNLVIYDSGKYRMNFGVCFGTGITRVMPYTKGAEFNIHDKKGSKSKYSVRELFELIGIKTIEEYKAYREKHMQIN